MSCDEGRKGNLADAMLVHAIHRPTLLFFELSVTLLILLQLLFRTMHAKKREAPQKS